MRCKHDVHGEDCYECFIDDMMGEEIYGEEAYEQSYKPPMRIRAISILRSFLSKPYVWYMAGLGDALIVMYVFKHFIG